MRSLRDVTNATTRVSVDGSSTQGEDNVSPSQPAQRLRTILDGESAQPFKGSGCSDHVRRRNLTVSAAVAVVLLIVLVALILI